MLKTAKEKNCVFKYFTYPILNFFYMLNILALQLNDVTYLGFKIIIVIIYF